MMVREFHLPRFSVMAHRLQSVSRGRDLYQLCVTDREVGDDLVDTVRVMTAREAARWVTAMRASCTRAQEDT